MCCVMLIDILIKRVGVARICSVENIFKTLKNIFKHILKILQILYTLFSKLSKNFVKISKNLQKYQNIFLIKWYKCIIIAYCAKEFANH